MPMVTPLLRYSGVAKAGWGDKRGQSPQLDPEIVETSLRKFSGCRGWRLLDDSVATHTRMLFYAVPPQPLTPGSSDPSSKIWPFFKMAGIRHLGFAIRVWTTHKEYLLAFVTSLGKICLDSV